MMRKICQRLNDWLWVLVTLSKPQSTANSPYWSLISHPIVDSKYLTFNQKLQAATQKFCPTANSRTAISLATDTR